jgi:hypothetical protein
MNFPSRFHTGVRNTTIVNPAWLHRNFEENEYGWLRMAGTTAETFEGLCSDYNFRLQAENYIKLRNILRRNGTDFLYVAAARYMGDKRNHRFVACSADGSLLWNKYVGFIAQGGQNHVYVAGRRVKTSIFLGLKPEQQDALLSASESRIKKAFKGEKFFNERNIDESRDLWN